MFEPEALWKQMHIEESTFLGLLYCRNYIVVTFCTKCAALKKVHFWHCWYFLAPPGIIRHPHCDLAPEELCPLVPPLNTSLCQRGQRSIALNHYVRVSTMRLNNPWYSTQHSALTQKFWQNSNYLQLGGLIDWLYVVTTIFAQLFNICNLKFERRTVPIAPPGYAPGSSYWWPYGVVLILLLQVQTLRQLTPSMKRHEICNQQHNA